jgi:hypothetical protein
MKNRQQLSLKSTSNAAGKESNIAAFIKVTSDKKRISKCFNNKGF